MQQIGKRCTEPGCDGFAAYANLSGGHALGGSSRSIHPEQIERSLTCERGHTKVYKGVLSERTIPIPRPWPPPKSFFTRR